MEAGRYVVHTRDFAIVAETSDLNIWTNVRCV